MIPSIYHNFRTFYIKVTLEHFILKWRKRRHKCRNNENQNNLWSET